MTVLVKSGTGAIAQTAEPPFVTVAYFGAALQFTGFPSPTGGIGAYGSAFAQVFAEVFEYEKKSASNAAFDPSFDVVVSRIQLADADWTQVRLERHGELFVFNMTTADGVFSLRYVVSQVLGVTDRGVLLTPKTVKIDIEIMNYPYVGQDTRLGVRSLIASAAAQADVAFKVVQGGQDETLASGVGINSTYVSWQDHADAQTSAGFEAVVDVRASVPANAEMDALPREVQAFILANGGTKRISFYCNPFVFVKNFRRFHIAFCFNSLSFFRLVLRIEANATVQEIYYTIEATQPVHVYWDPSVGVGSVPTEQTPNVALIVGVSVAVGFVVLGIVGGLVYYAQKKRMGASYTQVK